MPPRASRGGGRGGRGGASKPGFTRIGGMEIAYDPDIASEKDGRPQPSKTFPDYPGGQPPAPKPPTAAERRQNELHEEVSLAIRRGPLYTTFDIDSGLSSAKLYSSRFGPGAIMPRLAGHIGDGKPRTASSAASVDAFNMMPRYSDRYHQKRRKMPRLDRQLVPPVLDFFPEELRGELSPDLAKLANGTRSKRQRENFDENEIEAAEADEAEAADSSGEENEDGRANKGKKTKVVAEEGEDMDDADEDGAGEEGEAEEEDVDDDFEDDEDDMAGDYNAEAYFDDGGEDGGDDDVGDGDGGDYD